MRQGPLLHGTSRVLLHGLLLFALGCFRLSPLESHTWKLHPSWRHTHTHLQVKSLPETHTVELCQLEVHMIQRSSPHSALLAQKNGEIPSTSGRHRRRQGSRNHWLFAPGGARALEMAACPTPVPKVRWSCMGRHIAALGRAPCPFAGAFQP